MIKDKALLLPNVNEDDVKENYKLFGEDNSVSIEYLPNFSKINIFVGANNSGKSRFMRYLMKNKFEFILKDFNKLKGLIHEHNELLIQLDIDFIYNNLGTKTHIILNKLDNNYKRYYEILIDTIEKNLYNCKVLIQSYNRFSSSVFNIDNTRIESKPDKNKLNHLLEILTEIKKYINYRIAKKSELQKNIYIPTLRSAHSLYNSNKQKIQEDIFHSSIVEHHDLRINKNLEIFTGLDLYDEILEVRNSKSTIRKQFESFEKFVSKFFFNDRPIDIIANLPKRNSADEKEKVITIFFEGEDDRKLHELGDGIQALIILMYKIFMASKNSIIYIDEPELNLHPGMQRLFLEQLCKNKALSEKNLTYFIATHSNHLLDISIEQDDVSIYTFLATNDPNKKIIKNVNNGDNATLRELDVKNTSVFMSNSAIWVEGVSDRNYLKAFLLAYCDSAKSLKMPLEDIDFAFLEYAGSNIEHYTFEKKIDLIKSKIKALALNNKIFLLADSDNSKKSETKGKRLVELEKLKSDSFFPKIIWSHREVENLLPNKVWEKTLLEFRNKSKHKTDVDGKIQLKISKGLQNIKSSNFNKEYIGVFLNKLINNNEISELRELYEKKSNNEFGTFLHKKELSHLVLKKVINKEITWEDLSSNKEIKTLTIDLYRFIIEDKADDK